MGKFTYIGIGILSVILYFIGPFVYRWYSNPKGYLFPVIPGHDVTHGDMGYHARYRPDWTHNQFYFHWWNSMVMDSETGESVTFAYMLDGIAGERHVSFLASVRDADMKEIEHVVLRTPEKYFIDQKNSTFTVDSPSFYGSQEFLNGGEQIHVLANLNSTHTGGRTGADEFLLDVTLHSIHSAYVNKGAEIESTTDCSIGGSILFGVNMEIEGTMKVNGRTFNFKRSPRFRVYGGTSYGCTLPEGSPPIQFPWTWSWVSLPHSSGDVSKDVSIVMADARFASPIGPIYGSHGYIGLENRETISFRSVTLNHHRDANGNKPAGEQYAKNEPYLGDQASYTSLPLYASASDGKLARLSFTQEEFYLSQDSFGSAELPAKSIFMAETETIRARLEFTVEPNGYFRLPVDVFSVPLNRLATFSDFRACNPKVEVTIWDKKLTKKGDWNWLKMKYNDDEYAFTIRKQATTRNFSSVEFAYQAPALFDHIPWTGEPLITGKRIAPEDVGKSEDDYNKNAKVPTSHSSNGNVKPEL